MVPTDDHQSCTRAPLDFIVIGAQKAGTTSLHMHLRQHPGVYLPLGKEIPFFSEDRAYEKGWSAFEQEYYGSPGDHLRRGKVTNYMCDPVSPERISSMLPDVRLIAILRNPIERIRSHYMMCRRRGQEERSLKNAIVDSLAPDRLQRARRMRYTYEREPDGYVAWSEYGRILSLYLKYFRRDQVLILFSETYRTDPQSVIDAVLRHVGLEAGWTPSNIGKVFHKGGEQYRFETLRGMYRRMPGSGRLNRFGRRLLGKLPEKHRNAFKFWREIVLTRPASEKQDEFDTDIRDTLIDHFAPDIRILESDFSVVVPWDAYRPAAR